MHPNAHPDVFFPAGVMPAAASAPPLWRHRVFAPLALAVALHALLLAFEVDLTRSVEPARALAVQWTAAVRLSVAHTPTPTAGSAPAPARENRPAPATPSAQSAPVSVADTAPMDSPREEPAHSVPEPTANTAQPLLVEARVDTAYLDNPKPAYPPMSRRLGEEGTVLLRVDVGAGGAVSQVALERSCGYPRLDEAARRAVSGWRFLAARRGDLGVASTVLVPVTFALGDRKS